MADNIHDLFNEKAQWTGDTEPEHEGKHSPHRNSRRAMRKARREKQNKRTKLIVTLVVIVAVLAGLGVGVTRVVSNLSSVSVTRSVSDYDGPGDGLVSFTIEEGQSSASVAKALAELDIVKTADAFSSALAASGKASALQPGTFDLKYHMNSADVVNILTDATQASGFLVVTPGERFSKIVEQAAELAGLSKDDFQTIIDAKGNGILPAEANGNFEGWVEPGNYTVKGKTAEQILQNMVNTRIKKLDELGVPQGQEREQILNMASIAESEVNKADDYGKVVRVILNRLDKGMTLGMDSTVAYGLGVRTLDLTKAELADASNPYNTRVNKGLPPTPIAMAGDNAIKAALNPPAGNWLYFVTTNIKTGETKFTDNEQEFEQFSKEYQENN